MARPSRQLVDAFSAHARAALEELGFKKRKYDVFVLSRSPELSAWVGLNKATETAGGLLEVNPLIGAHHRAVEEGWARFAGTDAAKPDVPTVRVHIGYLMPQNDYVPWYFDEGGDVEAGVRDLVEQLHTYGLPWVDRLEDHGELVAAIDRRGLGDERARMLPVALWLADRNDEARRFVRDELERIADQANPAADVYRGFAEKFLEQVEQSGRLAAD